MLVFKRKRLDYPLTVVCNMREIGEVKFERIHENKLSLQKMVINYL